MEIAKLLLQNGAPLDATNDEGKTALDVATRHGYGKQMEKVLSTKDEM